MSKGYLSVARKRAATSGSSFKTSDGNSNFFEVRLGAVAGHAAVKSQFLHINKIRETLNALTAISHGDDKEKVFLALCDMSTKETRAVEKVIKDAKKILKKCTEIGNDFDAFFYKENIDLITRFGSDEASAMQFSFELVGDGKYLQVRSAEFGYQKIPLKGLIGHTAD